MKFKKYKIYLRNGFPIDENNLNVEQGNIEVIENSIFYDEVKLITTSDGHKLIFQSLIRYTDNGHYFSYIMTLKDFEKILLGKTSVRIESNTEFPIVLIGTFTYTQRGKNNFRLIGV